jgi:uncharacterized protein with HEPN domain
MSDRHPTLLLQDILDSAGKILNYTEDLTYDEFIADSKTIDAVIRNFEVIGEASNRLPEEFKNKTDNVDWFRVRGFRNRIVHQYFGIDYEIVWNLKETHLKVLISEIENILNNKNNF